MMESLKKITALPLALILLSAVPSYAQEKPKKIEKIKLETLKPGKIKLDSRLGYVLVRVGPKAVGKNPDTSIGFIRIDPETNTFFDYTNAESLPADYGRTLSTVVNVGRSFGDVDGAGIYLVGFYPGRWVIAMAGPTCLSMGTYTFDVKQGEITDIGTLLVARENGQTTAPELKDAKLSQDLLEFGTMMNIVMSEALFAKPADVVPTLPKELATLPVTKANLTPDFRFKNSCQHLVNRAASLPPLGHQPPMTRDEAIEAISKINPPERVEAARKKAEKAKAAAATKK